MQRMTPNLGFKGRHGNIPSCKLQHRKVTNCKIFLRAVNMHVSGKICPVSFFFFASYQ